MRRLLTILALLFVAITPAAALDFPDLDGRVVDEAHLLDDARLHGLDRKLAGLEARTSRQLMVVTLSSARGLTVEEYALALRKHWQQEPNGKRVALIVLAHNGRSVIQFDRALNDVLPESVTNAVFRNILNPRFNMGDFANGVMLAADAIIKVLDGETPAELRSPPQHIVSCEITVPATMEFPALCGRVVDDAGILDASAREALRARLADFEAKSGTQIAIAIVRSLHGNAVEDYANRLFRHWKIGQKGANNGVLLLHAPNERKIRIEVGYGLEGTLTDALTKTIIQNAITPRFKADDFAGGFTHAVDEIIKVLSGDPELKQYGKAQPVWDPSRMTAEEIKTLVIVVPIVLVLLGLIVVGIWNLVNEFLYAAGYKKRPPHRRRRSSDGLAYSSASSSWSSGSSSSWSSSDSSSSSSSDSFSGGGGDSGGGGASGDY